MWGRNQLHTWDYIGYVCFFFAMCTEFHLELELGLWQIVPFFGGAGKYGPGHADQQPRRPGTWRAQPI